MGKSRSKQLLKQQRKKIKRRTKLKLRALKRGYPFSKDTVGAMIEIASIKAARGV